MKPQPSRREALAAIRKAVAADRGIPSLPQVLIRVERSLADQRAGGRELGRVILDDPALTAQVLKLANSVYYNPGGRRVNTVSRAIVILGFETIRQVVLGLSVFRMIRNLPRAADYRRLWRHSLAAAIAGREIARRVGVEEVEEAFVGGLLHDIGKFFLGHLFPSVYGDILVIAPTGGEALLKAEEQLLKCSHHDVGGLLAEQWGFPRVLGEIMADHLPERWDEPPERRSLLLRTVAAADRCARLFDLPATEQDSGLRELVREVGGMLALDGEAVATIVQNLPGQVEEIADLLDIVIEDLRFHLPGESASGRHQHQNERCARARNLLEFILEVSEAFGRGLDLSAFVDHLVPRLVRSMELADVVLLFPDADFAVLRARYGYGEHASGVVGKLAVVLSRVGDVAVEAYRSREPVIVDEDHLADYWPPPEGSLMAELGSVKVAAVPIGQRDRVLGVLAASRPLGGQIFSADELRVIMMFAGEVARHLIQRGGSG
ncbi:MAG: HDOD domain-containing protein [Deltaproteobacteria bacterium]|nr:HDOD domain-containing protein [Candidatus Anaeroferrophillacea bacterium]